MRARRHVIALVLASGLLLAPAAHAEEEIVGGPGTRYGTPNVTMDQGEPLYFRNVDLTAHDVRATTNGPDGKPLFKTPIIGNGERAFVEGSQHLTTGSYGFFCSLHPSMRGTLNVSTAGTPVPRPAPGTAPPPDTTAPTVEVKVRSTRLSRVRRARRLTVQLSVDEAAKVALKAAARLSGRRVTLAKGSVTLTAAGTRRPALKLTRAGRRALRTRRRAKVTVTARAVDGAGNAATDTARRTLTR